MKVALISGLTRADLLWKVLGFEGDVVAKCCRRFRIENCYKHIEEYDVLVGHSLGGIVAKMAVVLGGLKPSRVFTIATPHQGNFWTKPRRIPKFFREIVPDPSLLKLLEDEWPSNVGLTNIYGLIDPLVPVPWSITKISSAKNYKTLKGHLTTLGPAKRIINGYLVRP